MPIFFENYLTEPEKNKNSENVPTLKFSIIIFFFNRV